MRLRLVPLVLAVTCLFPTGLAFAGDAGETTAPDDAGRSAPKTDGGAEAGAENSGDSGESQGTTSTPLACDGALCDTTNGSNCAVSTGVGGAAGDGSTPFAIALGALLGGTAWRRRRGAQRPGGGGRTC